MFCYALGPSYIKVHQGGGGRGGGGGGRGRGLMCCFLSPVSCLASALQQRSLVAWFPFAEFAAPTLALLRGFGCLKHQREVCLNKLVYFWLGSGGRLEKVKDPRRLSSVAPLCLWNKRTCRLILLSERPMQRPYSQGKLWPE